MTVEATRESLLELLELQRIDSAIDLLSSRLHNLPEQTVLDGLEERQRSLEAEVGEREAALDEVAGRQRKLETEIENIGLKIAAEETRANTGNVGSARELSSIAAEVESLKRRRTRFEDEDLEVMEEREQAEKELDGLRVQLQSLHRQVAEAIEMRDVAAGAVGDDLIKVKERKKQWVPRISPELLSFYNDLRAAKHGVGAAALQGNTCQGCHMQLPAQEVARVRASQGLIRCDECGRILVVT